MSKRFDNLFHTLVLLALTIGITHFTAEVSFSADIYSVPQTAEVRLAWDANDPAPDGYRIYQRTEGQAYEYSQPSWTGSGTSGSVYNLEWDTTYYYVVRAYVEGLESADSEEVSFVAPSPEPLTYTILAAAGGHGSISPVGPVIVTKDSDKTLNILPDAGYHVVDVTVDGLSKGAISSYTFSQVTANHTIDASFAIDTYAISSAAGANGNITPAGITRFDHGSSQSYTISPAIGHRVADVLVDGVSMGAVNTFAFKQIEADHTIHATFTAEAYAITAIAGANGTLKPAGVVDVPYGGSQTYEFAVNSGFCIADVQVDGQSVGAVGHYTFSDVKSPHTISVVFSESMVVRIQIEAEDGDLVWPMEIGDDAAASAGGYIWVPEEAGLLTNSVDNAGYAEYHFDVLETGDYVVWGRVVSSDTGSDSYFVSVDSQTEMIWKAKLGDPGVWTWDAVSVRTDDEPEDTTNPKAYRLEAGSHILKIKQHGDSVRLDAMVITNDLSMGASELEAPFQAPSIEADPYSPCISELSSASLSLNAPDPNIGNLTYAWELPDGGSIIGAGRSVVFVPEAIGPHASPYRVHVIVSSDASVQSSTYTFYFYVKLAGDINGDGYVDFSDLTILRADFGETCDPGMNAADVNRDGYVNFADLAILRSQFGKKGCACP